jgi:hypothetical protein
MRDFAAANTFNNDELRMSELKGHDYLDSKSKEKGDFEKLFRENYIAVCQIYNELPMTRLAKNVKYDSSTRYLKFDNCNICDKSIKTVLYTLYSIYGNLYGLSFSNNQFFKDACLKQLIDILPEYKTLKGLKLEKITASDSILVKFIDLLPSLSLKELSLSGNPISFFCFDNLC